MLSLLPWTDDSVICNIIIRAGPGAVYTWGHNQDGQLGLGDFQGRAEAALVEDTTLEAHHVVKVGASASCLAPWQQGSKHILTPALDTVWGSP